MFFKNKSMKYKINEKVYINISQEPKQIIDAEIIDEQEIYFMSDGTCYHVSQIILSLKQYEIIKSSLYSIQDQIKNEMVVGLRKFWKAVLEREKLRNS